VFVDVIVPDYSAALVSATPLVLSATPGRAAAPKELFSTLLPLVPTAERLFVRSDKVTAFMRVYQSGQSAIQAMALRTTIRDANDQLKSQETRQVGIDQFQSAPLEPAESLASVIPPRPTVGRTSSAQAPAPTPDKFANLGLRTADLKYPLPLTTLGLGPHLLTVEATIGATTIRRDLRFEVK
jgi:hypothetical protein